MVTRVIRTVADIEALHLLVKARKLPCTVEIVAGAKRTNPQNNLQHRWYADISEQLGDRTVIEVKRYCKLHHGVPILRAERELFREQYDRLLKSRGYEEKLEMMDFWPVTSLMTVKQETAYLDAIHREFSAQGVRLTDPEGRKYEGMAA